MKPCEEIGWLKTQVIFDEARGILIWADGPKKGEPACHSNGTGYRGLSTGGCRYTEHRVIWALRHGAWPLGVIDHVNGTKTDNRISNLRDVSRRVNNENKTRARTDNKLGLLGVEQRGKSFRASIQANGRIHKIGTFPTAEAAHAAYLTAKRKLHEGCTI